MTGWYLSPKTYRNQCVYRISLTKTTRSQNLPKSVNGVDWTPLTPKAPNVGGLRNIQLVCVRVKPIDATSDRLGTNIILDVTKVGEMGVMRWRQAWALIKMTTCKETMWYLLNTKPETRSFIFMDGICFVSAVYYMNWNPIWSKIINKNKQTSCETYTRNEGFVHTQQTHEIQIFTLLLLAVLAAFMSNFKFLVKPKLELNSKISIL